MPSPTARDDGLSNGELYLLLQLVHERGQSAARRADVLGDGRTEINDNSHKCGFEDGLAAAYLDVKVVLNSLIVGVTPSIVKNELEAQTGGFGGPYSGFDMLPGITQKIEQLVDARVDDAIAKPVT